MTKRAFHPANYKWSAPFCGRAGIVIDVERVGVVDRGGFSHGHHLCVHEANELDPIRFTISDGPPRDRTNPLKIAIRIDNAIDVLTNDVTCQAKFNGHWLLADITVAAG
jgi:hypothetical protein